MNYPFVNILAKLGWVSIWMRMFAYNLRFPGQQYDPIVGLHYNYYRDYDPAVGRYVESDPIGLKGGPNTYLYANARPLDSIDPNGLDPVRGAVWGGNAGTAIGGVLGGPPGAWIGRVLGSGIGAGLGYLVVQCLKDEPETCRDHYQACLLSGWGGKVGYGSACQACFDRCNGSGSKTWPDSVTSGVWGEIPVYCDYWSMKGTRQ
jgi:RHS repeat-associated protein